jgi:hypothetical protein
MPPAMRSATAPVSAVRLQQGTKLRQHVSTADVSILQPDTAVVQLNHVVAAVGAGDPSAERMAAWLPGSWLCTSP